MRYIIIRNHTVYWRDDAPHRYAGKEAVTRPKKGAPYLRFEGRKYKISHVMFFHYTGRAPRYNIYTKDGNPMNFRYDNLYEAKSREYRPKCYFSQSNKKVPNFKEIDGSYTNGDITFANRAEAILYHLFGLREKYPKGTLDPVFEYEIIQSTDLRYIQGPEGFNQSFQALNHWISHRQSKGIHLYGHTWQLLGTISTLLGFSTYMFDESDIFRHFPRNIEKTQALERYNQSLQSKSIEYPKFNFDYHPSEAFYHIEWQRFFKKEKEKTPEPVKEPLPPSNSKEESEYRVIKALGLHHIRGPEGCTHSLAALRHWVDFRVKNYMPPYKGYMALLNLILYNFDYPTFDNYPYWFYDLNNPVSIKHVDKVEEEEEKRWKLCKLIDYPVNNYPDIDTTHMFKDYEWEQPAVQLNNVPKGHYLIKKANIWTLKSIPADQFFEAEFNEEVREKPGFHKFADEAAKKVLGISTEPEPVEEEETITVAEDFTTALLNSLNIKVDRPKKKERRLKIERKYDPTDIVQRAMDDAAERFGWPKRIRNRSDWDVVDKLFDEGIQLRDNSRAIEGFKSIVKEWKDASHARKGIQALEALIEKNTV